MRLSSESGALLAVLAGCALFTVAAVYFAEPAASLPAFFPGHAGPRSPSGAHHDVAYGLATAAVGIVPFAYAWVATRPPPHDAGGDMSAV